MILSTNLAQHGLRRKYTLMVQHLLSKQRHTIKVTKAINSFTIDNFFTCNFQGSVELNMAGPHVILDRNNYLHVTETCQVNTFLFIKKISKVDGHANHLAGNVACTL